MGNGQSRTGLGAAVVEQRHSAGSSPLFARVGAEDERWGKSLLARVNRDGESAVDSLDILSEDPGAAVDAVLRKDGRSVAFATIRFATKKGVARLVEVAASCVEAGATVIVPLGGGGIAALVDGCLGALERGRRAGGGGGLVVVAPRALDDLRPLGAEMVAVAARAVRGGGHLVSGVPAGTRLPVGSGDFDGAARVAAAMAPVLVVGQVVAGSASHAALRYAVDFMGSRVYCVQPTSEKNAGDNYLLRLLRSSQIITGAVSSFEELDFDAAGKDVKSLQAKIRRSVARRRSLGYIGGL